MAAPALPIRPVGAAADVAAAAALFRAYAASLSVDLAYQGFDAELATLPGTYAPPAGALLLAGHPGRPPLGCVALRPLAEPGLCEMKRLYVAPEGRRAGVGRALVEAALQRAAAIGYAAILLDTLPEMTAALTLYRRLGFAKIPPYNATPIPGVVFMRRELTPRATADAG
jgi:ribosomal protein S18 acetylase RimI-like enzyme